MIKEKDPIQSGWYLDSDGIFSPVTTTLRPAPDSVLALVKCTCAKGRCNGQKCSCKSHNLVCTELCHCIDCDNEELSISEVCIDDIETECDI